MTRLDKELVEKYIEAVMTFNGDTYSQPKRNQKGYSDCSSIIEKSGAMIGLWSKSDWVTTYKMGVEKDRRFREIPMSEMQRGDCLWWHKPNSNKWSGHVGVYLGDNKVFEATPPKAGIFNITRLKWQRCYRIIALETDRAIKEPNITKYKAKGIVSATTLNIRQSNSIYSPIVGKLTKGTQVDIIGKTADNWFKINKGFISGAYVDLINTKPVENVPILINGVQIGKGYIIDGTTFMSMNGQEKPVRKVFESIGADVKWVDDKVLIRI